MIIAATIGFFAVLAGFLFFHYQRWLKQRGVNHKKTLVLRSVLLIPSLVWFALSHPGQIVWTAILAACMMGFTFWVLFDGIYNKLRGFDWFFEGGFDDPTEKDSSWFDQLVRGMDELTSQIIKVAGAIVSIGIYIITYFKLKQ